MSRIDAIPRILIFVFAMIGVSACNNTLSPVRPAPEGQLGIMGPGHNFSLDAPPKDWIISTDNSSGRKALSTVTLQGVPALQLESTNAVTVAVRQVDAMLLATPYLSWSWNLSDHGPGIHPTRIVVGFSGGADNTSTADPLGGGLPTHDRAIALIWGDTMLRRGTLNLPPPERPTEAPLYTVRGGRENTRRWWLETVDLSQLYAQSWPGDDFKNVRITFIGIAAAPKLPPVQGRVAGILLSH